MSDALKDFPLVSAEDFDKLPLSEQRMVAKVQNAQIEEKLKRAKMVATQNLGLALDRKNEVLSELLSDCKSMLQALAPTIKNYVADQAEEEVEWEQEGDKNIKKTLVGKIRGKDRRVASFMRSVQMFERIAHNAATVPQVFSKGDTNILNLNLKYSDTGEDAESDWEQTKKSALDAPKEDQ